MTALKLICISSMAAVCLIAAPPANSPVAAETVAWIQGLGGDAILDPAGRIVDVSFARTWVTDNDIQRLVSIKTIKRLDLSFTYVSDRGVELLQQLPQLEELSLDTAEFITDAAASYLRANRQLKRLSLRGTDVTDISMDYLSALTGLTALDIGHTQIGDVGMDHLASFPLLEELNVGGDKISGNSLNVLKLLPKLRKLSFSGIQRRNAGVCWAPAISDRELDTVSLLSGLEELDLGAGLGLGVHDPKSGASDAGESHCHVVGGTRITDIGLAKIAKLKLLKRLDLSGAEVTPAGLSQLERLPQLRQLSLWNCKALDDSAATAFAALPKIAVLDLSYTQIGDRSLEGLSALPNLKQLYLTNTRVTADSVKDFRAKRAQVQVYWGVRPPPLPVKPPSKDAGKEMTEF